MWRGRGCVLFSAVIALFLALVTADPVHALADTPPDDLIPVPSGQPVRLTQVLVDHGMGEAWAHFRFLAPALGAGQDAPPPLQVSQDMEYLCASFALPYLQAEAQEAARVIIALSDRVLDFGQSDPEATQFFETFRPEGPLCIWEAF